MKNRMIIIFLIFFSMGLKAHDASTLQFILDHRSSIENQQPGTIHLAFSMQESFSKEKVTAESLQGKQFDRAFILSSKALDFLPIQFRYEKELWQVDMNIKNSDVYWIWLEGRLKKLDESFMTPIRIKVGEKVIPSQVETEVLKSESLTYSGEMDKNKLTVKLLNNGQKLQSSDLFWNDKWQVVVANNLGSKLIHAELKMKKESSEIQVVFPHKFKAEMAYRLWIYNLAQVPMVFAFKWNQKASN